MSGMKASLRLTLIWIALVFGYMLWESRNTAGPVGWLLSWQYSSLNFYKPSVTFLGLVLLFTVPIALLYLLPMKRRRREAVLIDEASFVIRAARRQLRVLLAASGVAALCAVACFVAMLMQPHASAVPSAIQTDQRIGGELSEGSAYLDHPRAAGPVARYNQRLLWLDHYIYFVPIATGGSDARTTLFVEVTGDVPLVALGDKEHHRGFHIANRYDGVLVRGAMPPSIVELYDRLGVLAPSPHYTLFTNANDVSRPWMIGVLQFAFGGLVVLVFAYLAARRLRRLESGDGALSTASQTPSSLAAT